MDPKDQMREERPPQDKPETKKQEELKQPCPGNCSKEFSQYISIAIILIAAAVGLYFLSKMFMQ